MEPMTDRHEIFERFNPYATAAATIQAGDDTGLFLPEWDGNFDEEGYTGKEFAVYAAVQFIAKALANPFEVATILQQVQFLPSDSYLARYGSRTCEIEGDSSDVPDAEPVDASEDESDESVNAYAFHTENGGRSFSSDAKSAETAVADASGYLMKAGHNEDEPTRPPYQLPPLEGSTLATVGEILASNSEGLPSLWKGHIPSWLHETSHSVLQPSIEGNLTEFIREHEPFAITDVDDIFPSLATKVASHAISSFILSPLDLVRTRLVVQTSNPYHRKYKGTLHAFRTIISEEGFVSLYAGRHLIPTLLHQTLKPLFHCSSAFVIENLLNISSEMSPFLYALAELGLKAVELVVMLPLETVRRRLQCQVITRVPGDTFEGCVEQNPIPYTGLVDCAGRVVLEEGGVRTRAKGRRRRKRRKGQAVSWWGSWGVSGLYRGFRMRMVSAVVLMVVNTVADMLDVPEDGMA
ncbi:hypothetical protein SpCBS45565_g01885 [Spizellomyces sp. 'palustris']|nr:hypothetical protein SpCBS45565_g01885 [Spizellomyces sp. 'palustris']